MANRVVILGAGPAGLGGAYRLRALDRAEVTVLEQGERVGGNAGSTDWDGHRLDFGSHRLHPACDPAILTDIRRLLGDDLLDRPRHGRIRLRGRWIHFPLHPLDLLLRLDPGFAVGTLWDMVFRPKPSGPDTFASVLRGSLGPTICDSFYFPYARKIWGEDPNNLSAIQARRRVSAGSFGKLIGKVLRALPGLRPPHAGRFYYPRGGFGQICEVYAEAARQGGAEILLGWKATRLTRPSSPNAPWRIAAERGGEQRTFEAEHVWSTIPVPILARLVTGDLPPEVREAASAMRYRAMLLVYLALDVPRFTEFDAHYFPDANLRITRLSEPKNYAARAEPTGRTVLCAELPCAAEDSTWTMTDAALGQLVAEDLSRAGIPLPVPAAGVLVHRLKQAYPIYDIGYEHPFGVLDAWAESLPRLLTYGRQGLFAHDNTHHALAMAYAAADCLQNGTFDAEAWASYRHIFATHVVED